MELQEKYIVYLGLNDKDTKKQERTTKDCIQLLKSIVSNYFYGATISSAIGYFEGKPEKSIRIELLYTNEKTVLNFATDLRDIFNQQSVLVEKSVIYAVMV